MHESANIHTMPMHPVNRKDAELFAHIEDTLAENDQVMAWRIEDHKLAVESLKNRDLGEWEEHDTHKVGQ